MKKNNIIFVSEHKNAYTYYLDDKLNKLYGMLINKNVSVDSMKKNIRNYIWNSLYSYNTNNQTKLTKKKWFLDTVYSLNDKKSLYLFCKNSVMKARNTQIH